MPDDTPTIVTCHGLTGGSHESYVRNILAWVIKPRSEGGLGGRAVVINVSRRDTPSHVEHTDGVSSEAVSESLLLAR